MRKAPMADNWISITLDTVYEGGIAELIDACSEQAKATGQPDRAPGAIKGVVDEVRAKIASCRNNRLDDDETTVPVSLKNLTIDLVIARLKKALEFALTQDERDDLARHERKLNRIADCLDVVSEADTPEETPTNQSATLRPSICKKTRHFDRASQEGL